MSFEQKLCEDVQCCNMYRPKVCCHKFWYILSSLNVLLEQSENENQAIKNFGSRLRDMTFDIPFFLVDLYEPIAFFG